MLWRHLPLIGELQADFRGGIDIILICDAGVHIKCHYAIEARDGFMCAKMQAWWAFTMPLYVDDYFVGV